MRAVVTRVAGASVTIVGNVNGRIGRGFLVLLGVGPNDTEETADRLAEKICNLRVFEDENGKMNLNLEQTGGALLVVSQFTLYADTSSRRPGFTGAAKPDAAIPLYERFMAHCRASTFSMGSSALICRWTPGTTAPSPSSSTQSGPYEGSGAGRRRNGAAGAGADVL